MAATPTPVPRTTSSPVVIGVTTTTFPSSVVITVPQTTTTAPLPPPRPAALPPPPGAAIQSCPTPPATPPAVNGDPVPASHGLASALVCATTDVVVADAGGKADTPLQTALEMGAPLVYASAQNPYDPAGLSAARVWTDDSALVAGGRHTVLPLPAPSGDGYSPAIVEAGMTVAPPPETVHAVAAAIEPSPTLVVVSTETPWLAAPASAAANAVGGEAVWAAPGDFRHHQFLAPLAGAGANRLLAGNFPTHSPWQLDVLAAGKQLPGGGQVLFPGRRLVALYGHPQTGGLGVLGEQSIAASLERVVEVAAPYVADDVPVLPTFEIIATTASSRPGADGNYSGELSVADLEPWVSAAGEAGVYVVLDLQPGRTDFLSQARMYEELLRLPHVGLALDPEWRLFPDQVHLEQIGSVTAAEINEVVDWMAGLVRSERLPQKLLVVHQFKLTMITDRVEIRTPPELAVVIQMDGQGPLGTKYATWDTLVAADEGGWWWGWKNFYDEDRPTPTPGQVLDLEPAPVFISYQ